MLIGCMVGMGCCVEMEGRIKWLSIGIIMCFCSVSMGFPQTCYIGLLEGLEVHIKCQYRCTFNGTDYACAVWTLLKCACLLPRPTVGLGMRLVFCLKLLECQQTVE